MVQDQSIASFAKADGSREKQPVRYKLSPKGRVGKSKASLADCLVMNQ